MKRFAIVFAVCLAVALLLYLVKIFWSSRNEYLTAESFYRQSVALESSWQAFETPLITAWLSPKDDAIGESAAKRLKYYFRDSSLLHLRRALNWNIYNRQAEILLQRLVDEAVADGEKEFAVRAYREWRSAIYAARSFFQPKSAKLAGIDFKLLEMSDISNPQKNVWLNDMQRPSLPYGEIWAGLTTFFFGFWMLATSALVFRGFDASGKLLVPKKKYNRMAALSGGFVPHLLTSLGLLGLWLFCLARVK